MQIELLHNGEKRFTMTTGNIHCEPKLLLRTMREERAADTEPSDEELEPFEQPRRQVVCARVRVARRA
jgi:hypothetical protein